MSSFLRTYSNVIGSGLSDEERGRLADATIWRVRYGSLIGLAVGAVAGAYLWRSHRIAGLLIGGVLGHPAGAAVGFLTIAPTLKAKSDAAAARQRIAVIRRLNAAVENDG